MQLFKFNLVDFKVIWMQLDDFNKFAKYDFWTISIFCFLWISVKLKFLRYHSKSIQH
jgi:hypothetical protein